MQRASKSIIALLFTLCLGLVGTATHAAYDANDPFQPLSPSREQAKTSLEIIHKLNQGHYRDTQLDDALSSKMLDRYLDSLDSARVFFTAADIADFEQYRHQLDDALAAGDLAPAFTIYNRYQERAITRMQTLLNNLDTLLGKLDFDKPERLHLEREDTHWAANQQELDEVWRKRVKNSVLSLKLAGKDMEEISSLLRKRYENQLRRLKQTNSEDAFQVYINAFTRSYDPHTQYFSPRRSETFNINMRLSLEGIGAVLQSENEYTKIVRLVPGGPAAKGGELKPADRIVGVGQGTEGEIVDVIGWRLDEVVDLIRGPKGTQVRLEVIPAGAVDEHQTQIITITRNTVKLEEQAAQKELIKVERDGKHYKIGVITIPAFYVDFEAWQRGDSNYRSTTRDVKQLLAELQQEGIDGLLIDLRNNGGGALQEANSLVGLFIQRGPTVQVRNADGKVDIYGDPDPEIAYDGPLAVLVNRLSASASEIFAGAIQDYQRGLVIGDQTFGKGTVQTLTPLTHGQLKITRAKFYRISGESTQHQGVIPDIRFPDIYDHDEIGESALEDALPWDMVRPVRHRYYGEIAPLLPQLQQQHQERIIDNPDFTYFIEQLEWLRQNREKNTVSLHEQTRQQERASADQWQLALENKRRKAKGLKPFKSLAELEQYNAEQAEESSPYEDANLTEAGEILLDFIQLSAPQLAQRAAAN